MLRAREGMVVGVLIVLLAACSSSGEKNVAIVDNMDDHKIDKLDASIKSLKTPLSRFLKGVFPSGDRAWVGDHHYLYLDLFSNRDLANGPLPDDKLNAMCEQDVAGLREIIGKSTEKALPGISLTFQNLMRISYDNRWDFKCFFTLAAGRIRTY